MILQKMTSHVSQIELTSVVRNIFSAWITVRTAWNLKGIIKNLGQAQNMVILPSWILYASHLYIIFLLDENSTICIYHLLCELIGSAAFILFMSFIISGLSCLLLLGNALLTPGNHLLTTYHILSFNPVLRTLINKYVTIGFNDSF